MADESGDAATAIGVLVRENKGYIYVNPGQKAGTPLQWMWAIVGGLAFVFAFNSMSASYHWPTTLPGLGFDRDTDRYAVALIATPVLLILLLSLSLVGRLHAQGIKDGGVKERLLPPFGFGSRKARWLQIIDFFVIVFFPLISSISLFLKFLGGEFCLRGRGNVVAGCDVPGATRVGSILDHLRYVPFGDAVLGRKYVYQGGPDYAPFWEPCAFMLLWVGLVVVLYLWWKELSRPAQIVI